jgi:hypothetical protein
LAPIGRRGRPLFDKEVIAAVCECPSLTYELLVATREGVAVERVELDETSRPAAGLAAIAAADRRIGGREPSPR